MEELKNITTVHLNQLMNELIGSSIKSKTGDLLDVNNRIVIVTQTNYLFIMSNSGDFLLLTPSGKKVKLCNKEIYNIYKYIESLGYQIPTE